MSNRLKSVDLYRCVDTVHSGHLVIAEMERIADLCFIHSECLGYHFIVRLDVRGLFLLRLEITGEITSQCQRCLGDMSVHIHQYAHFGIGTRQHEQVDLPSDDYEYLSTNPARFNMQSLIEDEFLLSVPMMPKHDDLEQCGASVIQVQSSQRQDKPFANLASLKNRRS